MGAHRLRQTTGAVGVTTAAAELADLGLQGASGGREGPSQIGVQARELQAGGPPVGVSPEQEGISPPRQEIIPPMAGGIEGDLQAGNLHPILDFLFREQVQRLEMELQMAQQTGFQRITPEPFLASGLGLQAGDVVMADVPTSSGGGRRDARPGWESLEADAGFSDCDTDGDTGHPGGNICSSSLSRD